MEISFKAIFDKDFRKGREGTLGTMGPDTKDNLWLALETGKEPWKPQMDSSIKGNFWMKDLKVYAKSTCQMATPFMDFSDKAAKTAGELSFFETPIKS